MRSIPDSSCPRRAVRRFVALGFAGAFLAGCSTAPKTFSTPEAAVDSLVSALRHDDTQDLKRILGSDADAVLSSGDPVADKNGRAEFLQMYDERHWIGEMDNGSMVLQVGPSDWPVPIPVVEGDKGWYFDTAAGLDEMLSRRIGRNELNAIQVCLAIADAEREYASQDLDGDGWCQYAAKFNSDPGTRDGLYWPPTPTGPQSPLGELVAAATNEGYFAASSAKKARQPFHGYFYRILTGQGTAAPGGAMNYMANDHMIGGFAVVAWPADYGNSGIKSFMVSHHGIVYERDLGDDTGRVAKSMKVFDPGAGWEATGSTAQAQ